jgi:hypothetical protein
MKAEGTVEAPTCWTFRAEKRSKIAQTTHLDQSLAFLPDFLRISRFFRILL